MEKETRKSFSLDCAPELSISGKYIYPKVAFNTLLTDLRINVKINQNKTNKIRNEIQATDNEHLVILTVHRSIPN